VLLAENETELQKKMLSFLNDWCIVNGMFENASKVMLCILDQIPFNIQISFLSVVILLLIEYFNKYMYLGILLTEHLDYNITAKTVAQSAGRALVLLIAKYKSQGGLPYEV
jgi:hypothetical protein